MTEIRSAQEWFSDLGSRKVRRLQRLTPTGIDVVRAFVCCHGQYWIWWFGTVDRRVGWYDTTTGEVVVSAPAVDWGKPPIP